MNTRRVLTSFPDITCVDFEKLRSTAGMQAVVFDKDNTLTAPYVDSIHPPFQVKNHLLSIVSIKLTIFLLMLEFMG